MEALIIKTKNKNELKLLKQVVNKMGMQSKTLSEEDIEDMGLSLLMKQADRSKTVSRDTIMRKIRQK